MPILLMIYILSWVRVLRMVSFALLFLHSGMQGLLTAAVQ